MPCYRFYLNSNLVKNGRVALQGDQLHHMKNVMRLRVGETVEIINGRNQLAQARIDAYQGNQIAHVNIDQVLTQLVLDKPRINLIQPLIRSKGLDLVIEKCTELGVSHFYLYASELGEISQFSSARCKKLTEIAISAIKQCGRLDLPTLTFADRLHNLKLQSNVHPICFGDTRHLDNAQVGFTPQSTLAQCKTVCIGPEKGFSDKEINYLENQLGATGIKISPFILRSETASITLTALTSYASILKQ
ncbi:Ribosomal RNA small subunit methyltransferase E [Trichoplax sp. H2]|uniref:16S rRNA (uracil(1498)-N(3))-methyltransferase n=1 Tax=Trichoplax adhaerens TaxID=10228 RepID=B3RMY0_TRIAD|nr:hypothetical protein TRIADDRAFT_52966 [Trichoplax adhaerens]EDV27354.1 hypothetical protein TRIADDRAFT_52966 [Trichoplax adhaerens]RDD39874.1 Ribosomal RNA small subunit methyltransferase E [Trichoplax sp. H2]|eukprot:XP_002109188.1 hypothetical protein TRIADDRAFT_52966 [Trichoplax adhaerens]